MGALSSYLIYHTISDYLRPSSTFPNANLLRRCRIELRWAIMARYRVRTPTVAEALGKIAGR